MRINRVVTINLSRIRELASQKGLSLTRLEEELKFPNGTICKWKNTGSARVNTLYLVAEYLGVDMDELLEKV